MRYSLSILVILCQSLAAQYPSGLREIIWSPVQHENIGGHEIEYLHFNNASYDDLNTLIPKYYELININNISEFEVRLENTQFETFDNEEIKRIEHLEDIPADIQVYTQLLFVRKQPVLAVSFIPIRKNNQRNTFEKLVQFSFRITPTGTLKTQFSVSGLHRYAQHSVLNSGSWFKIMVKQDGIYKLTYEQLLDIGIDNPTHIRLYGNGGGMLPTNNSILHDDDLIEVAIWFESGEDGTFNSGDYILFYGEGPHTWQFNTRDRFFNCDIHKFSDANYYFLTSDMGPGKTVHTQQQELQEPTYITSQYDYYLHHEKNEVNLIKSGSEWYGEHFDIVTSQDFPFTIPRLVTSEPVRMRICVLARASDTTSFTVSANNTYLGRMKLSGTNLSHYTSTYAYSSDQIFGFTSTSDQIGINLQYAKNSPSAQGWLDYITLNARRELSMTGNQMLFVDSRSAGSNRISEFRLSDAGSNVIIWEITDHNNVRQQETTFNANEHTFRLKTDSIRQFIAFNRNAGFLTPTWNNDDLGYIPNQDLHGASQMDYIIISHPDFLSEARRLAAYYKSEVGLDTLVVTPNHIYNEFSSGMPDVSAMRNFVKLFYDRASGDSDMPSYLLLFGDGSFDNTSTKESNTNFILTYQSANSLSPVGSYLTDDYFGLLDDGENLFLGMLDIGIGRFPVKSVEEAREVVNKTLSYMEPDKMGDWRNTICFIGDDDDGNIHMRQSDELARYVETNYPNFVISKIFLDAYQQISTPSGERYPEVNEAINQRVNKGALILNYTGHGGENGLAHERILDINDIINWENAGKLPLFMTATCEFSRFDDYEHTSAGELVLLNPDGGGIALLTTTRLVYSAPNHELNEHFYRFVFENNDNDQFFRLGDIMRLTKNNTGSGINKRNFTLLGDPALILSYPKYHISTTMINGKSVTASTDTIRALEKVTIAGQVEDEQGVRMEQFNGTVYPTIFDKVSELNTLSNDGGQPFSFDLRDRILYKGKASVTNGQFSFSFIVPKDISYNYGSGKISFYANDASSDASGSFTNMIVGGSSDSISDDTEGPDIKIFMNDDNFVFGGTTNENPQLLVWVNDSNGINTVGSGIGHDLTAILDGKVNNPIILNDYYESDTDSYQSGKIIYPLRNLEAGQHNLSVKVWDVHNNSSEEYTEFVVVSSEDLVLKHVLNYPNPFTTHTSFYFEHNHANSDLDVIIQVFTVSGKLVKTIEQQINATGYRCGPIDWDGTDDYGSRIGRGVYVYRIKVRSSTGQVVEKFEKLVILR